MIDGQSTPKRRFSWVWLIPLILTLGGAIERLPAGALGHNWFGDAADDARVALKDYMLNH